MSQKTPRTAFRDSSGKSLSGSMSESSWPATTRDPPPASHRDSSPADFLARRRLRLRDEPESARNVTRGDGLDLDAGVLERQPYRHGVPLLSQLHQRVERVVGERLAP